MRTTTNCNYTEPPTDIRAVLSDAERKVTERIKQGTSERVASLARWLISTPLIYV